MALLLLSIFLALSASLVFGQTKRDASFTGQNDGSGLRPDVNRQQSLVIDADFESGVGVGVSLSNGATVDCEEGNCFVKQAATALQDRAQVITFGQNSWQDYSVKFRFNVRSGDGGPHVTWRDSVDGRFFTLPIGQSGFRLIAEKVIEQGVRRQHTFSDIRAPYRLREWNTLEFRADGDRISVFLNGNVVADEVVPREFRLSGGIARIKTLAAAGGDVEIWYDDLEVRLLNQPEPTPIPTRTPTPTPTPDPATIQASKVVVALDFESGIPSGISLNNGAIIACEDGNCFSKHVATATQRSSPNVWFGRYVLGDYTFKFRFNVRSGNGGPSVRIRRSVDGQYQIQPIGQNGFRFAARKTIEENVSDEYKFSDIRAPYPVREWNTLEMRAEGDRISVILNGDLVASEVAPADFRYTTGHPAITTESAAGGDVEVWYDDIEVRLLNLTAPPPAPTPTPTPPPTRTPTDTPSTATSLDVAPIAFFQDFEGDQGSEVKLVDGGVVACEEGNCFVKHAVSSSPSAKIFFGDFSWQDYEVVFRFNVRSRDGAPSVRFHATPEGRYLLLGQPDFQFELNAQKQSDSGAQDQEVINEFRFPFTVREWHTMSLTVKGSLVRVNMDGRRMVSQVMPDNWLLPSGMITLVTVPVPGATVEVWYDDIEVRLLNAFETTRVGSPGSTPSQVPGPASSSGLTITSPVAAESSDSQDAEEKSDRGFFTNTRPGESTLRVNSLFDPTTLAVIGIMITMLATMVQLFRGK